MTLQCRNNLQAGWSQFGSVRLRWMGRFERFRFSVPTVRLWKKIFLFQRWFNRKARFRFRFLNNGSDGSGSDFGSWKNGSDSSSFQFRFGSWATLLQGKNQFSEILKLCRAAFETLRNGISVWQALNDGPHAEASRLLWHDPSLYVASLLLLHLCRLELLQYSWQTQMGQNGPFWPRKCQNPVRNKVSLLGQKRCRTKSPQKFLRFFSSNFAPKNAPKFPRIYRGFSCFVSPTVPQGHKHRVTTLGRSCGTPPEPRKAPQSPAEPSKRPPQKALRTLWEANLLGEPHGGLCPRIVTIRNFRSFLGNGDSKKFTEKIPSLFLMPHPQANSKKKFTKAL